MTDMFGTAAARGIFGGFVVGVCVCRDWSMILMTATDGSLDAYNSAADPQTAETEA